MIKARPKYPTDLYGTIYIDNIHKAVIICLIIPTLFPFDAGTSIKIISGCMTYVVYPVLHHRSLLGFETFAKMNYRMAMYNLDSIAFVVSVVQSFSSRESFRLCPGSNTSLFFSLMDFPAKLQYRLLKL